MLRFLAMSTSGHGGNITLIVGTGNTADGGNIIATVGASLAAESAGGNVIVTGGEGSDAETKNGGNGGSIHLIDGEALGLDTNLDTGGAVENCCCKFRGKN